MGTNTYANTALDLQNFIKHHFPILYPYIKTNIKDTWNDENDALGFINDCIKQFSILFPEFTIDFVYNEHNISLYVYYTYKTASDSCSIEFKPFLNLKETRPEQYEILINLYRFIFTKLDHWHTNELDYTEEMIDMYNEDKDEEEQKDIQQKVDEYKTGLPFKTKQLILKSKIKLPLLKCKVAELDEFSKWDIDFKKMCISAIALIETNETIYNFVYYNSIEQENNESVTPNEYCQIFWEVDESCPYFYFSEELSQAKYNEGGSLDFRYVQNLTESKTFDSKIPDFPNKALDFLNDSLTFQNNHLYGKRK